MAISELSKPSSSFWRGKRVCVTGHTGFKGSWLCETLLYLGADVYGFALAPPTNPNLFEILKLSDRVGHVIGDVRDFKILNKWLAEIAPDVVMHLAAQPIVSESYSNPRENFFTNIMGTVNLLEACRIQNFPGPIVVVTSDKCYENNGKRRPFSVGDPLGGADPYSASKAAAEIVSSSYRESFKFKNKCFGRLATARAGNVIGGGDYSKDRLIPDLIRAWTSGAELMVRNPHYTRPWQHVIEPIAGYLLLAEKLESSVEFSRPWNFGPDQNSDVSVLNCVKEMVKIWPSEAKFKQNQFSEQSWHEASTLSLDISESISKLNWRPMFNLAETLKITVDWYLFYMEKKCDESIINFTKEQISSYFEK